MGHDNLETIVRALRCANTIGGNCLEHDCPYYTELATAFDLVEFCRETGSDPGKLPPDFSWGCDYERIGLDAAYALEESMRLDLISRADLFNRLSGCQDKAEIFAVIQSMPNA